MPNIDINSNVPRLQFTANASQTEFSLNFIVFANTDLVVVVDGVTQTLTTHYTVSDLSDEDGATVTFVTPMTGGELVTIYRRSVISRESQYQQDGRFDAEPLERDLDKITTYLQEQARDLARALVLDPEDTATSLTLPISAPGFALGWSAGGELTNISYASISSSIDTVFTSLTDGDLLKYNGTNWVNSTTFTALSIGSITAPTTAGFNLKDSNGNICLSGGAGGAANLTMGGNMSGASTHKLVNMADPSSAQDYTTKAYVDGEISSNSIPMTRIVLNGTGTPAAVSVVGNNTISSVTDHGAGQYTLNFGSNYADTNYGVQITTTADGTAANQTINASIYPSGKAVGSLRISLARVSASPAFADVDGIHITIIGELA